MLEISVDHNNGHSPCICYIYKTRVVYLEKPLADFTASKTLAKSSQSELRKVRSSLKRCKVTRCPMGVSPDTSR